MRIKILILLFILTNSGIAMDFDKEISLKSCLTISECNQGVLSEGGWAPTEAGIRNSKLRDIRCVVKNGRANLGCMGLNVECDNESGCWIGCSDGWGCWTVYDQACRDMDLNLQEEISNFPYHKVWEKKSSYFETNFPKEFWNLIQNAAQFEIDCYEKKPSNAKGHKGQVYNHCPDLNNTTQNCKPVKGVTKTYSKEILKEAKDALYKKWTRIAKAQSHFDINEAPRNLKLLQGEFSSLKEATFDEYNSLVNSMDKSNSLPEDIKKYITQEKQFLNKSKKFFEQQCSITGNENFATLNEMQKKCTRFYLTSLSYNTFEKRKKKRLKDIEIEYWEKATKQAKDAPQEAIGIHSLIAEYLKKYPNGVFFKQAEDLYEKTLALEGKKEARRDTMLGLSEKSLLQKYLSKYPQGQFTSQIVSFLEKLLFNYSISQIKIDANRAILPNSYPEQYLQKYPAGKYIDSLNIALENAHWTIHSTQCKNNQTIKSCAPLFTFFSKFPKSKYIDSIRVLIDEPMWSSIDVKTCIYLEDDCCSEIEKYIESIPQGKHTKEAKKVIANAQHNSEKRENEEAEKKEREEKAIAWYSDYEYTTESCSFNTKKDTYDFEWNEEVSFPEKNGIIECIEKKNLTLDSSDTLFYKCIETDKIIVKNRKISGGTGYCVNALEDTLIRKTYLNNGKDKNIMYFPGMITLTINENGVYSINSKKKKITELDFFAITQILSFVKSAKKLSYLNKVNNVEFEWTKSGQIKNILIKEIDDNDKILSKLIIPLNAKGQLNGISEIYTASTGNFKIEWSNGSFKRIFDGGKKLKASLCPDYVCENLINELYLTKRSNHYVVTIESSRETANYEGLEEGWMIYYISFLLGISINQGLEIWDAL